MNSYTAQILNFEELVPSGSEMSRTLVANIGIGSIPAIPEVKKRADGSCDLSQIPWDVGLKK